MEWISVNDLLPKEGDFVVAIRLSYPGHYWVGQWEKDSLFCEDPHEYWPPVPEISVDESKLPGDYEQ